MKRTLVVIPTYNEAENIGQLARELVGLREDLDVLVVDDASPDGTGDLVEALGRELDGRVSVLRGTGKGGRGAAVLAGIRSGLVGARYDRIVEMDADLSHLPEQLPDLLAASSNADLVIGSRYSPGSRIVGWSRRRRAWSRVSNRLLRTFLRLPTRDYTNGFRVYSRRAAEVLAAADLRERGYIALSEWACVLHDAGMRFADVPTTFVNRRQGASKMGANEAAAAFRALIRLRRRPAGGGAHRTPVAQAGPNREGHS